MTDWGLVATVKAAPEKVRAFAAHHLSLGAAHLWLCFDDPDDPAFAALDHPRITRIRCDAAHWTALGGRPDRHQNRQARNAQWVYRQCRHGWLGHIDVDEFLWPDRPVSGILDSLPAFQVFCRLEPHEAMHDPALPDDIFTARLFRAPLKILFAHLREPVLGRFATLLPEGMLSHSAGKVFFRTGVPGLSPRLHGAFVRGHRLPGPPFEPGLPLLHFHAQDRQGWLAALPFRLTHGAYQYHPELQAFLTAATPAEVSAFYEETQILTEPKIAMLRSENRLVSADLHLRRAVSAAFPVH